MADEDVKIVIKQKGTIPVYTKTKVGVAEVYHDESLEGKGTVGDPLKVSEKIIVDIDSRVEKTSEADKVYGTDAQGNQTTYDVDGFGKVDDVLVNGTSVVTNKIAEVEVPTAVSELTNDADYQTGTQVNNTVSGALNTHNTSNNAHSNLLTPITQDIDAIEEKIPAEASSSNQLADKAYVDDQIGDLNEWTTAQYTPTTTNFVVGNTYTVEEAFQRTASLFEGQQDEIDDIEALIPAQATEQNQLADKSFVNATIATNSANFRGNWATWADVPTQANLYPEDYVGSRTPTNNDYMVVADASAYIPDLSHMPRVEFRNMRPRPDGAQGASICDVFYYPDGINEIITYNFDCINNGVYRSVADGKVLANWWYGHDWTIKANAPVYYNDRHYNSGDVIYNGGNRDTIKIYFLDSINTYEGSWRFMYIGTWATDGKNGWNPVYQIGTAFTQEQQAAIDSGITANMVDNYVNPTSTANTAYNKRITAVETDKRDIINSANKVYATDANGANKNDLVYATAATADTIAQRGTNGVLKVGTPTNNADATTKLYVDTIASAKQDTLTAGTNITIDENNVISAEGGLPAGEPDSLYGTDSNGDPTAYKVKDGLVLERPILPDGYTEVEYIESDWANEAHVEEISTDRITVSCNVNPPRQPYISFFEQATQYVHFEVVSAMFECVDFNGYTNWKIHCYDKDGNEGLYYEHKSTSGLYQYWLIDVQGELHFGDYFILERTGWDRRQYIDTGVVLNTILSYDWDKTNGRSYNYAGVNVEINPTAEFDEYMRNGGYVKFKAQNDGTNDNFAYGLNGSYTSIASAGWIKEHFGIDITGDIVYASSDAAEAVHTVIWLNRIPEYPRYIIHTNAYVEDTTNTYLRVLGANNGNNSGIFCNLNGINNYYGWKTFYISYASLGLPVYKGWNDITIDNTTTQSYGWQNAIVNGNSSLQSFTSCYDASNILLFTANFSGSVAQSASLKMKRTTIQKDGVIVFDGVPAIRNNDGVAGMYDMANNVFKTSESDGDFVAGPVVEYPTISVEEETEIKNDIDDEVEIVKGFENDEYVQLTWLKSNGSQVIDLGISGAANHEYEICFKCDELGSSTTGNTRPLFGIYSTSVSQTPGYALKFLNNKLYRVFATGGVGAEQEVCGWDDNWHVVRTKKSYTEIDGVETRNISPSDNYIDSSWGLFGVKTGSPDNWSFPSPYSYFVGKISYFRDYCSGILVREFVPVRRKSDGELGFYCIQEDRFCPNVITGYEEGFQGGEIFGTRVIKKNTSDILPGESIYNTIQKQRVNTYGNLAYGYQTSYGSNARPDGPYTTVIGANSNATNSNGCNTVVGANAETGSYYNTLVGAYTIAQGSKSTVVGYASRTDGTCSVVVGNCRGRDSSSTYTTGNYTVSVGYGVGARGSKQSVFVGNSIGLSNLESGYVTWAVCIGDNAQIGANYGIAIGSQANIHAGAVNSVAIGSNAHAYSMHSVAIGNSATVNYSSNYSTAIGYLATVESNYGIQLGYGYNNETASLYVGFGTDYGNYKLLGSTGVIPYQRLTTATAVDGYCLKYDENSDSLVWGEAGASIQPATDETLGGIIVGSGLSITEEGVLSADAQPLQPATANRLGGVKVGNGLSVAADGTLSADVQSNDFEDIGGDPYDNQALSDALNGLQNNIDGVQDNLDSVEADLQNQINNISSIGEFLAIWDSDTGIARYLNAGFVYPTGGYFIIGSVAAQGQPNYMPDGSTYTGPSTTTTTEDVKVSDMWFYDGTHWIYLANHERQIAVDADLSTTSINPVQNRVITAALDDKQDTLTAGNGIDITDNVISVVNDSVGVPQIANVYAKQLNKAEQATARMAKESYLGFYSDICFNLNLSKEQIIDKMDELYIGLERFKRNRVSSSLIDPEDEESEDIDYRNIPAFKLQNDHFVHTDRKMYCYRYYNEDYSAGDPRRYTYFYSNNEYSTYQDMLNEDQSIYCFYGEYINGNKASCLNTLRNVGVFSDYEKGDENWERYPDGDIEVFVNVNKGDSIANGYITLRVCRQYIVDGQKEYYWSPDWEDPMTDVYAMTTHKIPTEYTDSLESVGRVEDLDGYEYVKRPDLNYWTFNFDEYNLSDWFENILEPNTLQGAAWGDDSREISWRCYWLDYPLQPVLLQDCDVINKDGNWTKLKDVIADGDEDNLPENITFRYPYNSAEIWLRFSAWQKRCMYNEYSDERDEYLQLTQKQALAFAWEWDQGHSITGRRAFGRQRNMYSGSAEHAKISEYIQFNLYEPYNVYGGTKSKSTPIQKRITINKQNGSSCIRN